MGIPFLCVRASGESVANPAGRLLFKHAYLLRFLNRFSPDYFICARIWSVMAFTAASASGSRPTVVSVFASTAQVTPGRHSALSQSSHSFMLIDSAVF